MSVPLNSEKEFVAGAKTKISESTTAIGIHRRFLIASL